MPQGRNKKALTKRVNKRRTGYPVATIAFNGPDNSRASKVVCSIVKQEGAEPEPMKKWFTDKDESPPKSPEDFRFRGSGW
jgi:hypothetical protein